MGPRLAEECFVGCIHNPVLAAAWQHKAGAVLGASGACAHITPSKTSELPMSLFAAKTKPTETYAFTRTDAEWQQMLTPEQFKVMRGHGTERACTSPLNAEKRAGAYDCAGCGQTLFDTSAKFESGTGWPSFFQPVTRDAVGTTEDRAWGMVRTEVHCSSCGSHLGHVFPDGPAPTGLRYCMNGVAMTFQPAI